MYNLNAAAPSYTTLVKQQIVEVIIGDENPHLE